LVEEERDDEGRQDRIRKACQDVLRKGLSVQEVCETYVLPRSTLHRYVRKIKDFGWRKGLQTKPQSEREHPHKVKPEIVAALMAAKEKNPEFGSKRLADVLEKENGVNLARTTIRKIVGAKKKPGRRGKRPARTKVADRVGQILLQKQCQVPVRGLGNVTLQLIVDSRSRYAFARIERGLDVDGNEVDSAVRALLEHACKTFNEWGIPIEQIATRYSSQYCGVVEYLATSRSRTVRKVVYAAMINRDAERASKVKGFGPEEPSPDDGPRGLRPKPATRLGRPARDMDRFMLGALGYNWFQTTLISPRSLGQAKPIRHVKLNNGRVLNRDTCLETFRRVLLREFFEPRDEFQSPDELLADFEAALKAERGMELTSKERGVMLAELRKGAMARLEADLRVWLHQYNHKRTIHAPPHNRRTPMAVVKEYLDSPKEA